MTWKLAARLGVRRKAPPQHQSPPPSACCACHEALSVLSAPSLRPLSHGRCVGMTHRTWARDPFAGRSSCLPSRSANTVPCHAAPSPPYSCTPGHGPVCANRCWQPCANPVTWLHLVQGLHSPDSMARPKMESEGWACEFGCLASHLAVVAGGRSYSCTSKLALTCSLLHLCTVQLRPQQQVVVA